MCHDRDARLPVGTASARGPVAARGLAVVAGVFLVALLATADRYGYHRDELYFLAIGARPAWGYVDQPPLIPLLAHAVDAASGHSLFWLRVPPALAGAATTVITGLTARDFGAGRRVQVFAAATTAVSAILVSVAHLASTSAFDLLVWAALTGLIVRALRDDGPAWLAVGGVAGVGLEIKTLPVFLLFAVVVGVLLVGPRSVFRSRWAAAGVAVALVLWAPNLVWQATHGWPQLALSTSIAAGSSGTSQPRWLFLPYQVVLVSPVLVPVWVAGLWRLARDPALRRWRALAVAYPVLVVVFLVVGGKPYYLCGLYPVLLAAGADPTLAWARRGASRVRTALLTTAVGLSAGVSAFLMLPLVPVASLHATPVVAVNYDAGETVGWPAFAATVGGAWTALPPDIRARAVFVGENYGETGAVRRYRPALPAYGTQNSLWALGPPPAGTTVAIVVGYPVASLRGWFGQVRPVATMDNRVDLDNEEQGEPVYVCSAPVGGWATFWAAAKRIG